MAAEAGSCGSHCIQSASRACGMLGLSSLAPHHRPEILASGMVLATSELIPTWINPIQKIPHSLAWWLKILSNWQPKIAITFPISLLRPRGRNPKHYEVLLNKLPQSLHCESQRSPTTETYWQFFVFCSCPRYTIWLTSAVWTGSRFLAQGRSWSCDDQWWSVMICDHPPSPLSSDF